MATAACNTTSITPRAQQQSACRTSDSEVTGNSSPYPPRPLQPSGCSSPPRCKPKNLFIGLPDELRLEIYDSLSKPEICRPPSNDELDIARFITFDTVPNHERHSRKSYSFMLSHRRVFEEAIDIVCATHPLVFYNLNDIQRCRHLIQHAREIILDVERVPPNAIQRTLHRLKHLPKLERLEFRASPCNIRHIRLPSELGGFPALIAAKVVDVRLQREEQRHANQYALEAKMLQEKVERLEEEIRVRESCTVHSTEPGNFSTIIGDFDRLHLWSSVELFHTKHDLQLKLLWRHQLRNSPEPYAGSRERRIVLHCQDALLKQDLWIRRETEEGRARREMYEERCVDCGQTHW